MSSINHEHQARQLWLALGLPEEQLSHLILTGDSDSAINSSFKLATAVQTAIGLSGLSAANFHTLRTGVIQDVTVDARHAVLASHGEAFYMINGEFPPEGFWDSIAGYYQTRDDNYVRIHTNFPHHRSGELDILGIPDTPSVTRDIVSDHIKRWDAVEFETEAASRGMCVTVLRSFREWDLHPHGRSLSGIPPVSLTKIGEAPKREADANSSRPLDGIRVLDLSRVLAGPVAGRTLAVHGADVLLVSSPNLPTLPLLDVETSLGKRTTQLDLTSSSDCETLLGLAKETDVFMQAYRPGGLEEKGFGVTKLASLRPGIIYANLTAWGWKGPWKDRRGFDSLVQTAMGFNMAEAEAYRDFLSLPNDEHKDLHPRPFPFQAIDHAAGYFLAFGINAALCKTITEGGSWEVRVSLAAVGQWIRSLGRLPPVQAFGVRRIFPRRHMPLDPELHSLSVDWILENEGTKLTSLSHPAILSVTPAREGQMGYVPKGLNADDPKWL